ncbi:RDD family protein [Solirubrobacter phytolaccae]|uniref:RDD family protein n=1 Tax=Solirubrobacter phytolaccae TaxID=1404360 RepID=A0A9X3NEG5_9ACTN|nr:RDD family protein [Solirubrobacter phytolaccae]MDA0183774.1 RDD family protein [Solirubrobacter phytolaccae]
MTAPVFDPPPRATLPPFASFGARALAGIVDALVIVVPVSVALLVLSAVLGDDVWSVGVVPLALVAAALYYPRTMGRTGSLEGQTWGKQIARIRVLRVDGQPVTAGTAVLRDVFGKWLIFTVLAVIAIFIPTLVNFVLPLFDKHKQALHDKMAATVVVRADLA